MANMGRDWRDGAVPMENLEKAGIPLPPKSNSNPQIKGPEETSKDGMLTFHRATAEENGAATPCSCLPAQAPNLYPNDRRLTPLGDA